jgi:hypothetical protein
VIDMIRHGGAIAQARDEGASGRYKKPCNLGTSPIAAAPS